MYCWPHRRVTKNSKEQFRIQGRQFGMCFLKRVTSIVFQLLTHFCAIAGNVDLLWNPLNDLLPALRMTSIGNTQNKLRALAGDDLLKSPARKYTGATGHGTASKMRDLSENVGPAPAVPNPNAAEKGAMSPPKALPLKDSPKRNLSPGPVSPTRAFSPPKNQTPRPPAPAHSAVPSTSLSAPISQPRPAPDSDVSMKDEESEDGLPFRNVRPGPPPSVPEGALDYTPLAGPMEVYIHPDDSRDKVLAAIIKVILRTGNIPATPRELSGLILKGNVALLGWVV